MISNSHILTLPALALALLTLPGRGDDLLLQDGGKVSGKVSGLTADGHLLMDSPLSITPLDFRTNQVKRINFATPKAADEHDSLVVLTNGDQFSCDLQAIDAAGVTVDTSFAGPLTIPRSAMRTLQLGVRPRKVVYQGPENAEGWDIKNGWHFVDGTFEADAAGILSRSFELPENHSIRFELSWGAVPNLQLGFDDDVLDPNNRSDRYILNLNGGGIDLKREQKEGRRFLPIASVQRNLMNLPDQHVTVELRVDRRLSVISLYIDDKYEGRWMDPAGQGHSPGGKGLFFRGNVAGDETMTLENLQIGEWDASSDRHRSEERGDRTKDSIILRDGDRGKGDILGYRTESNEGLLKYKMPQRAEPLETPASEISTLFFAEAPHPAPAKPNMSLMLQGRGALSLESATLGPDGLHASHPLLGPMKIRSEAFSRLDRLQNGQKLEEPEESGDEEESADDQ